MHTSASIPALENSQSWPFSKQFQHLADQNPFWSAKFPVHFQWGQQSVTYKISYLQKMDNRFLILISSTGILVGTWVDRYIATSGWLAHCISTIALITAADSTFSI